MKKIIKTLALMIFFSFALAGFAFADVAPMGPIIVIGLLMYAFGFAVVIIAVVLVVKLIIKLIKNRK